MPAVNWSEVEGRTRVLATDPTTDYTVQQIIKVAQDSAQHPAIIEAAQNLSRYREPVRAVFDYAYNNVVYYPDPEQFQDIKYAHKTLQDGSGNCVDYTVLISALLQCLHIPHKVRVAAYEVRNEFEHIYPVTANGVTLDCVIGQLQDGTETFFRRPQVGAFNQQVPYLNKRDYTVPITLRALGSTGNRNYRTGRNYRQLGILLYCGPVGPVDKNRNCKKVCVEHYPNCSNDAQSHLQKYCKTWCNDQDNNDVLPTAADFANFEATYDYSVTDECPPGTFNVGGTCVQNPFDGQDNCQPGYHKAGSACIKDAPGDYSENGNGTGSNSNLLLYGALAVGGILAIKSLSK